MRKNLQEQEPLEEEGDQDLKNMMIIVKLLEEADLKDILKMIGENTTLTLEMKDTKKSILFHHIIEIEEVMKAMKSLKEELKEIMKGNNKLKREVA